MTSFVVRKLIVDEHNELFDAQGMRYAEFPSEYGRIRDYAAAVLKDCPETFLEDGLLEQQLSEIIKNGIKHGNGSDPAKKTTGLVRPTQASALYRGRRGRRIHGAGRVE